MKVVKVTKTRSENSDISCMGRREMEQMYENAQKKRKTVRNEVKASGIRKIHNLND